MINIRPDEISNIIRQQIESYDQDVKIDNIGTCLLYTSDAADE